MAASGSADVIEEDAADLQFPKDEINVEADWLELSCKIQEKCAICKKELKYEPVIRCYECSCVDICVQCFSLGLETQQHQNHHMYQIDRRHAPIFTTSDWPADLELDLLNAVLEFGYGNWTDISKRIQGKTPEEIRIHFNEYYLGNRDNLPNFPSFGMDMITSEHNNPSYKYSSQAVCEEPPRFPINTPQYRYFAGYNAARSDFEIEYDNSAESLVTCLDFDEIEKEDENDNDSNDESHSILEKFGNTDTYSNSNDKETSVKDIGLDECQVPGLKKDSVDENSHSEENLMKELKITLIQQYNECLKERMRRKRIIRNHGLLLLRKFPITLNKYENSITKSALDRLYPFMQLVSGERFDYILEGLDKEMELKRYFCRLKNFRECGLTRFYSCKIYEKLKAARDEMLKDLSQLKQNPLRSLTSINLQVKPLIAKPLTNTRKPAPPLNILLLPGYEKLTEEERELCSNARIVPESYFTFKDLLINENNKNNGIRLATARQLIKIDVNKTRKLFNFLRDKNLITQIP
ncbi:hypothetical protein RUM43_008148 [Polyplax serrata]|uniref:Transcriptional adapter n=1 Tax=Polyplax serrata TaxID=468196 RepID=A0AAN8S290_POLSC